jgi:hypothetical protein
MPHHQASSVKLGPWRGGHCPAIQSALVFFSTHTRVHFESHSCVFASSHFLMWPLSRVAKRSLLGSQTLPTRRIRSPNRRLRLRARRCKQARTSILKQVLENLGRRRNAQRHEIFRLNSPRSDQAQRLRCFLPNTMGKKLAASAT